MRAETLKGHLDFLLLAIVADEAAHGYRIIEELRERSAGTFDLPEGTVYPALHRLERDGSVVSRGSDDAPRRRRVYELTAAGREVLVVRETEWTAFARAVSQVAKLGPATLRAAGALA